MPKLNPKAAVNVPVSPEPDRVSGFADMPYESALSELERLVAAMESAQLPLDRLLESYQRGAVLLKVCRHRLEAVEEQVKILDNEQLKSWEGEA